MPRRGRGQGGRGRAAQPAGRVADGVVPSLLGERPIHEAEEGGFWAEVPSIPGCATQGVLVRELLSNLYEAVEGCLSVDVQQIPMSDSDRVIEIAV